MAILNNNPLIGSGGNQGYNINNSLRFRSSASAYLSRTPSVAGNRKTWTWSAWVKRGTLAAAADMLFYVRGSDTDATFFRVGFDFSVANCLTIGNFSGAINLTTTQVFRDPSAWYHIVVAMDTTQATASNRLKLYVNGTQVTAFSTANYPSLNTDYGINNTTSTIIGASLAVSNYYFDGYMAEVNFIDGSQKAASDFGETDTTTGVWKPKAYSGTYGTNGFYLKFSDIATTSGSNAGLGKDFSGNSNYWTTNNISVTSGTTYDAMTDVPTNTSATVANYAVMNPLDGVQYGAIKPVCTNGNLTATGGASTSNGVSTIALGSGKWYCEFTVGTISSVMWFGCQDTNGFTGNGSAYTSAGEIYCNGTLQGTYATFTTNDVIGCAFDITNNQVSFYKNGTQIGTTGTLGVTTKQYIVWTQINASGNLFNANFGQRPFSYTPPTGFVALNTYNL